MKKVEDYQRHAEECRDLARRIDVPEVRQQLLEMALVWEAMANERTQFIGEHPQFALPTGDC